MHQYSLVNQAYLHAYIVHKFKRLCMIIERGTYQLRYDPCLRRSTRWWSEWRHNTAKTWAWSRLARLRTTSNRASSQEAPCNWCWKQLYGHRNRLELDRFRAMILVCPTRQWDLNINKILSISIKIINLRLQTISIVCATYLQVSRRLACPHCTFFVCSPRRCRLAVKML